MASAGTAAPEPAPPGPGDVAALRTQTERYYTAKVLRHGATPAGVDWPCQPTQELRFVQLLRRCDFSRPFSLNDLGCGYGALLGFMDRRYRGGKVDYLGIDLSEAMVGHARQLWRTRRKADFHVGGLAPRRADFSVASGIFNVRLDASDADWESMVEATLADLSRSSVQGFAVNFLRQLPPDVRGTPELYRSAPEKWARFCAERLGMEVDLLDAYGMREFTLHARH